MQEQSRQYKVKKNVPGTSAEIERKLGQSMNDNGCQKAIVISIFCSSLKTKEVEE